MFQFSHFLLASLQVVKCAQRFVENRCLFVKVGDLIEHPNFERRLTRDRPRVRIVNAADDFEQSRFTGPIRADQTDFF